MTANALSLVRSFRLQISPTVVPESRQACRHEGKIICLRNQKTHIEQVEQSLPWVRCRHRDSPVAAIDHERLEAAAGSPVLGFGSDVIRAKDQVQAVFRHINPQICGRWALGYGSDNCNEMFACDGTSG
jgi:hypothetical protein